MILNDPEFLYTYNDNLVNRNEQIESKATSLLLWYYGAFGILLLKLIPHLLMKLSTLELITLTQSILLHFAFDLFVLFTAVFIIIATVFYLKIFKIN